MSALKMIAAFSENKPGEAARITRIIAESGANIRWVTIAGKGGFGVVKLLVDKCEKAMESLKKNGIVVNYLETLAIEVKDKPGSLQAVLECLSKGNVNVENTSGFVANNRAILVLEVQNIPAAEAVLKKQGLRVLTQDEILNL
jgi:hypothetical protein